ncbi:MAG TPA: SRPBCC family protein [Gemmatimonadaceae bacterium]|nr:SRPBCC family protein [Gemmatimonadaceae bacterium]
MAPATAAPRRMKSSGPRFDGARREAMQFDRAAHNVATPERVGSVALGAALVTYGVRRRDPAGAIAAILGSAFVLRGATGHCPVYRAMGISTGDVDAILGPSHSDVTGRAATVNARRAVKIERAVTIEGDRRALFDFWRDFENLPRFMEHLESVRVESPTRSHWVAKAPAGTVVEWDAEIINEIAGSLIAWKSTGHAEVPNAGSVHFTDAPGDRGTIVKVVMDVEPPAGKLGFVMARLFGEDPDRQVREDLRKFKQLMETGEITTSARRRADSAYDGATPTK